MIRLPSIQWIALLVLLTECVSAQSRGDLSFSGRGVYRMPVGRLNDLFVPTSGFSFTAGQRTDENWLWEGCVEVSQFRKGNSNRLYYPDLSLNLDLYGAGVQANYYLFGSDGVASGWIHPFLSGGVSTYRWFYTRGSHVVDSKSGNVVEKLRQQDWSLGFRAGGGAELLPFSHLAMISQISYSAVIGEIWPTLALRIEGVSVFQMIEVSLGVRYYLRW